MHITSTVPAENTKHLCVWIMDEEDDEKLYIQTSDSIRSGARSPPHIGSPSFGSTSTGRLSHLNIQSRFASTVHDLDGPDDTDVDVDAEDSQSTTHREREREHLGEWIECQEIVSGRRLWCGICVDL